MGVRLWWYDRPRLTWLKVSNPESCGSSSRRRRHHWTSAVTIITSNSASSIVMKVVHLLLLLLLLLSTIVHDASRWEAWLCCVRSGILLMICRWERRSWLTRTWVAIGHWMKNENITQRLQRRRFCGNCHLFPFETIIQLLRLVMDPGLVGQCWFEFLLLRLESFNL